MSSTGEKSLEDRVEASLEYYRKHDLCGRSLWEIFTDGYQETTKAEFDTLPIEARSVFREHLVANGVYVPKQRGMMVSQALYNAA